MTDNPIADQQALDADVTGIIRNLVQEHYGNEYDETLQRMIFGLNWLYGGNTMLTGTKRHLAHLDKMQRGTLARVRKDEEPDPLLDDMDFQIGDRVTTLTGACPGTVVVPLNWSPKDMVRIRWDHLEDHESCWQTHSTHMRPGQIRKVKES